MSELAESQTGTTPIISSPAAVIGLAEDHSILSLSGDGHILNAGTL